MRTERERWIGFAGLLIGFGLAFAVIDLAFLAGLFGEQNSWAPTLFRIGVFITGITASVALVILATKLRK